MKISDVILLFGVKASAILLLLTGCMSGPGFLKQENSSTIRNKESTVEIPVQQNADGSLTAVLSAGSAGTQSLQAPEGSSIAGSQLSFQPGSLAINTTVTIEEGSSLASASVAEELGIGSGTTVNQASSAVVISSSSLIDASQPFTVSLVLDNGSSLTLAEQNLELVVIYKVTKVESGSGTFVGIIPNKELAIVDGKLVFKTRFFGSYQAAYVPVEAVSKVVEKEALKPIETKKEAKAAEEKKIATEQSSGTVFEIKNLRVDAKTTSTLSLRWEQTSTVKHFIVAYAPFSNKTTIKDRCVGGVQTKVLPTEEGNSFVLKNLNPYTNYLLRVCAVSLKDEVSVGQFMTHSTLDKPPMVPIDFAAIAFSSKGIRLTWKPSSAFGYVVAYNIGSTGGAATSVAAPSSCKGATNFTYLGNQFVPSGDGRFSAILNDFPANTPVGLLLCGANREDLYSAGISTTVLTLPPAISCSVGTLDTVCEINGFVQVPAGRIVSGLGDLVIGRYGNLKASQFTVALPQSGFLEIDMKGRVELIRQHGFRGQISADGKGFPGGSGHRHGVNGNTTTGGSYGGQGGFDMMSPLPVQEYQYGDYRFPKDLGSGGGQKLNEGGSGGGSIVIRAARLINNGIISANGESVTSANGSGGSGGSVAIVVGSISADTTDGGFVRVNGGDSSAAGGGGGGRIAVHYNGADSTSTIDNIRFESYGGFAVGNMGGAAGTLYFEKRVQNIFSSILRIDNSPTAANEAARTFVELKGPDLNLLSIESGARAVIKQNVGFVLDELKIDLGAAVDHSGLGLKGSNTLDSTQAKNAGAMGVYGSGGGGAGFGAGGGGFGSEMGPPAGHGEVQNGDDPLAPVKQGGGGGVGATNAANVIKGGDGGGAIRLDVKSKITIQGVVRADGLAGDDQGDYCGGGGGGGAIWLIANEIVVGPLSTISAKGGSGYNTLCSNSALGGSGGGGGGGSIYLKAKLGMPSSPGPNCIVHGGPGYFDGLDGSAKFTDESKTPSDCGFGNGDGDGVGDGDGGW
jgi:hypothetical protein